VGPKQIRKFLKTLEDKTPKLDYATAGTGEFNGESLTDQAREATLLVTAIRTADKLPTDQEPISRTHCHPEGPQGI
jgi:hypothetical protein